MATIWDELPSLVIHNVKNSLSKTAEDKVAQDDLKNVLRAAEAVEEFTGIAMQLKMEMENAVGISGKIVKPLPEDYKTTLQTIFNRYAEYLAAFVPEEAYLKKKVEMELRQR